MPLSQGVTNHSAHGEVLCVTLVKRQTFIDALATLIALWESCVRRMPSSMV